MNILTNPWSFLPADVLIASPAASPTGFVRQSDGTILMTTGAAHGFTALQYVTVINATLPAYNGGYRVRRVPSATTAILIPEHPIAAGTAASGGGSVALCQYENPVRIEDMSWQNAAAPGDAIDMRDRMGNILWQATAVAAGTQNRGKIFFENGISLFKIDSGVIIVTIN